jgi:hypothetical protein
MLFSFQRPRPRGSSRLNARPAVGMKKGLSAERPLEHTLVRFGLVGSPSVPYISQHASQGNRKL